MNAKLQLVVVLDTPIRLLLTTDLRTDVECNGRLYCDAGLGGWAGFYDWLRSAGPEVIGIRTTLAGPEYSAIRDAVESHANVDRLGDEICIFFGDIHAFDPSLSDDQDLGDHRVLRASDGTFAFTFDASRLTSDETISLRRWCVVLNDD